MSDGRSQDIRLSSKIGCEEPGVALIKQETKKFEETKGILGDGSKPETFGCIFHVLGQNLISVLLFFSLKVLTQGFWLFFNIV